LPPDSNTADFVMLQGVVNFGSWFAVPVPSLVTLVHGVTAGTECGELAADAAELPDPNGE